MDAAHLWIQQELARAALLWIQQEVAKERIKVHYVNTEEQATDILTKSLALPLFENIKK
jgi:hypothetical protein